MPYIDYNNKEYSYLVVAHEMTTVDTQTPRAGLLHLCYNENMNKVPT